MANAKDVAIVVLCLASFIAKSQSRVFLPPGLFLPPQVACPNGQVLATVPEQACTSPFSCKIVAAKRCVSRTYQAGPPSYAPPPAPVYMPPQVVMGQAAPQYAVQQGAEVPSSRTWTSPPQTSTPHFTEPPTTTQSSVAPELNTTEHAAPVAFLYQPNLQSPSAPTEISPKPVPVDSANNTCRTVYEKVCAEGQTPQCQVLPKSSCQPANATSVISEPKTPGCTVQYLKACKGNSTQPCSVVPQKVCLDGTKTADSDALKSVLDKGMDKNKTSTQQPTRDPKTSYSQDVNRASTEEKPIESPKEAVIGKGVTTEGSTKEGDLKKMKAKEEDSLMECPKSLKGYDCLESTQKICKRIESPICQPQTFEKCTISPINETSNICNPVLTKICKLVASKPDSSNKASVSPPSNTFSYNQRPPTDDESLEVLVDERSKRDTGEDDGHDLERSQRASFMNHFGPAVGGKHENSPPKNKKPPAKKNTHRFARDIGDVQEENEDDEDPQEHIKVSRRDVSGSIRTVTTCVQKQVSVCSTNFTAVPKSGFKTSCVEVPSFSCKEVKIQGPYGVSSAENCTQYKRQVCNRFKSSEFLPQPQTHCQNLTVPDCYDETFDYTNTVLDKVQKPSASVVKCEEVEDQVCGLHRSVELVVDECFSEERSSCQSGYTDKCSDIKTLKCKSKTTSEELNCQII